MSNKQFEVVSVVIEELPYPISAIVLHEYALPYIIEGQMYLKYHLILYAKNKIFHGLRAHSEANGIEHCWIVVGETIIENVNIQEFDDALLVFDHKDTPTLDEVN